VTELSYYDWKISQKIKPKVKKKEKEEKINKIGLSIDEFKKFVKLWRSKNITF
jgi:hypothetical protein